MPETTTTTPEALPPVTDIASAARHIEGLLSFDDERHDDVAVDDQESSAADSAEEDVAPAEEPTSDETTDQDEPAESDEDAPAIVEPPASWTNEEKERFRELPDDLQQLVSRREGERDRAVSQRMNQLSEQRKAIEHETAKINETQTHYGQALQFLLAQVMPELREAENIPVDLAQTDPTAYVQRTAIRDGLRQRAQTMISEMQRVNDEQQNQFVRRHQEHIEHQYGALVQMMPEFRDPVKTKAIVNDIGETMQQYGFTPQEIAGIADARVIKVIAEHTKLLKNEQARKSANGKKTSAPAPKSIPATASTTREDRSGNKLKEQFARLQKTGSPRDAAAIFEQLL